MCVRVYVFAGVCRKCRAGLNPVAGVPARRAIERVSRWAAHQSWLESPVSHEAWRTLAPSALLTTERHFPVYSTRRVAPLPRREDMCVCVCVYV